VISFVCQWAYARFYSLMVYINELGALDRLPRRRGK
jgi:hypothetical protein